MGLGSSVLSLLSSLSAALLGRARLSQAPAGATSGHTQTLPTSLLTTLAPASLLALAARIGAACHASARISALRTLATTAVGMWALSVRLQNVSIVDVSWAQLFVLQASVYMLHPSAAATSPARKAVAWAATFAWAMRLSSFLWWRNHQSVVGMGVGGQAHAEDFRYQAFRK